MSKNGNSLILQTNFVDLVNRAKVAAAFVRCLSGDKRRQTLRANVIAGLHGEHQIGTGEFAVTVPVAVLPTDVDRIGSLVFGLLKDEYEI